jgi:hypothetical protein
LFESICNTFDRFFPRRRVKISRYSRINNRRTRAIFDQPIKARATMGLASRDGLQIFSPPKNRQYDRHSNQQSNQQWLHSHNHSKYSKYQDASGNVTDSQTDSEASEKPAAGRQSSGSNNNEKNEKKKRNRRSVDPYLDGFSDFYTAYPRHEHRSDAEQAWNQLRPDAQLGNVITSKAQQYAAACKVRGTALEFTKLPGTWLRGKCWTDEYEGVRPENNVRPLMPDL